VSHTRKVKFVEVIFLKTKNGVIKKEGSHQKREGKRGNVKESASSLSLIWPHPM
jgi:hypothetical protein